MLKTLCSLGRALCHSLRSKCALARLVMTSEGCWAVCFVGLPGRRSTEVHEHCPGVGYMHILSPDYHHTWSRCLYFALRFCSSRFFFAACCFSFVAPSLFDSFFLCFGLVVLTICVSLLRHLPFCLAPGSSLVRLFSFFDCFLCGVHGRRGWRDPVPRPKNSTNPIFSLLTWKPSQNIRCLKFWTENPTTKHVVLEILDRKP